jgi:hypothetical protein
VDHLVEVFRLRKLTWGRQKGLYNAIGRGLTFLCVGASPRYLLLIEQTRAKVHQLARMATSKWRQDDFGGQHRSFEEMEAAGQWLSDRFSTAHLTIVTYSSYYSAPFHSNH